MSFFRNRAICSGIFGVTSNQPPPAYQWAYGHIWNDFDSEKFREHCFAYPTINGVIGTIQWEGFREGVDDVRYITTLE